MTLSENHGGNENEVAFLLVASPSTVHTFHGIHPVQALPHALLDPGILDVGLGQGVGLEVVVAEVVQLVHLGLKLQVRIRNRF